MKRVNVSSPETGLFRVSLLLEIFSCLFPAVRAPKTNQRTEWVAVYFVFLFSLKYLCLSYPPIASWQSIFLTLMFYLPYQTSWNVALNFPLFSSFLPFPPFATEQKLKKKDILDISCTLTAHSRQLICSIWENIGVWRCNMRNGIHLAIQEYSRAWKMLDQSIVGKVNM